MPSHESLLKWLASVPTSSYYQLLRVPQNATEAQIKANFHGFALQVHPDRFIDEPPEVVAAASEAFKRGVEAYRVLSRPELRKRYDKGLAKGKLRLDDKALESVPPPPKRKTIEEVARTKNGKEHARKADRFVNIGQYDQARLAVVNALQHEPDNEELQGKLKAIYEAMARGPL